MINGTVHYVGIIKSNWISFDESLMEWKIYEQGTILATALAEKQTMALGKHKWTFYNNSECSKAAKYEMTFSLSSGY